MSRAPCHETGAGRIARPLPRASPYGKTPMAARVTGARCFVALSPLKIARQKPPPPLGCCCIGMQRRIPPPPFPRASHENFRMRGQNRTVHMLPPSLPSNGDL